MLTLVLPVWVTNLLDAINWYIAIPPWDWTLWGQKVLSTGDWLAFHLNIGSWIRSSLTSMLDLVNGALSYLQSLILQSWSKAVDAYNLAVQLGAKIMVSVFQTVQNVYQTVTQYVYNTLQTVYQTVSNVYYEVNNTTTNIYQTIAGATEDFVQRAVAAALSPLANPLNMLITFSRDIGEFFADAPGWIFDRIDNWLNEEV